MSDGITDAYNGDRWREPETDAVTLTIEQYGALVREREQAICDYERTRDALELAKQGNAGAISKAAKREALEAVLALRETAELACVAPSATPMMAGWLALIPTPN